MKRNLPNTKKDIDKILSIRGNKQETQNKNGGNENKGGNGGKKTKATNRPRKMKEN